MVGQGEGDEGNEASDGGPRGRTKRPTGQPVAKREGTR